MSKQANPTLIGGFVVGAVALLAIGVAVFGGSELLAKRFNYVAYFEEQTKGLRVGSNVVLNGVRIGYVSEIALLIDESEYETMTRVTLEILPEAYIPISDGKRISEDLREVISHDDLVHNAGLRAQLEIESFVTGQLLVRLDLRPDTPALFSGLESEHPEIPTIRSNIQEMLASIQDWLADMREQVDVAALTDRMTEVLSAFATLLESPDLHETLAGLNTLINDGDTQALAASLRRALDDVGGAADEARQMFASADDDFNRLVDDVGPVLARLNETLETADGMLAMVQQQVSGDSAQAYQLQSALREVEGAAAALREFFDFIERNPEALLKGKNE